MTRRLPILLLALAGCATDSTQEPVGVPGDCSVVSINSDYLTTSVSILNRDGTLCRDDLINSGSAPPGVVTSLSGDVVSPSAPHPTGLLTLIDRYPNGVLTFVNPDDGTVQSQLAVGTGFASNPQDVAFLDREHALVSRAETNRTPGSEPFDEGGDLLQIALDPPAITGRIDLNAAASPDGDGTMDPRPGRMVHREGLVWTPLGNLASDFTRAGPGTVVAVEPETGTLAHVLRVEGLTNCLALASTGPGLWGGCTGAFSSGEAQTASSGLFWLDLTTDPSVEVVTTAEAFDQPVSFDLTPVDENVAYFVGFGDRQGGAGDRLYRIDRRSGAVEALPVTSTAFQLGAPLISEGLLLVPDADPSAPKVLRLALPSLDPQAPTDPNPTVGLPPRHLAVFR